MEVRMDGVAMQVFETFRLSLRNKLFILFGLILDVLCIIKELLCKLSQPNPEYAGTQYILNIDYTSCVGNLCKLHLYKPKTCLL